MSGSVSVDKQTSFDQRAADAGNQCGSSQKQKMTPILFPNNKQQCNDQNIGRGNICIIFKEMIPNTVMKVLVKINVKIIFSEIGNSQKPREIDHKKNQKERPLPSQ